MVWVYADEVKIVLWQFFYHEQLYVVLLDLVAGGLLNARVRYLRFAFTNSS